MIFYACDFCGKNTYVNRTHYGTTFGYVRLICSECQKELGAEIIDSKENKTGGNEEK